MQRSGWFIFGRNRSQGLSQCVCWGIRRRSPCRCFGSRSKNPGRYCRENGWPGFGDQRSLLLQRPWTDCCLPHSGRLWVPNHCDFCRTTPRRRCHYHRAAKLRWVCHGLLQWKFLLRSGPEPHKRGIRARRLIRRLCNRSESRSVPCFPCFWYRRLHPSASCLLWFGGPEAYLWSGPSLGSDRLCLLFWCGRADYAFGGRCSSDSSSDRRTRWKRQYRFRGASGRLYFPTFRLGLFLLHRWLSSGSSGKPRPGPWNPDPDPGADGSSESWRAQSHPGWFSPAGVCGSLLLCPDHGRIFLKSLSLRWGALWLSKRTRQKSGGGLSLQPDRSVWDWGETSDHVGDLCPIGRILWCLLHPGDEGPEADSTTDPCLAGALWFSADSHCPFYSFQDGRKDERSGRNVFEWYFYGSCESRRCTSYLASFGAALKWPSLWAAVSRKTLRRSRIIRLFQSGHENVQIISPPHTPHPNPRNCPKTDSDRMVWCVADPFLKHTHAPAPSSMPQAHSPIATKRIPIGWSGALPVRFVTASPRPKAKHFRLRPRPLQQLLYLRQHLRMLLRNILLLPHIHIQVIQLKGCFRRLQIIILHCLPLPLSNRNPSATLMKFPIQIRMLLLLPLPQKSRQIRNPIQSLWYIGPTQFAQSRHQIPKSRNVITAAARLNLPGPARNRRNPNSSFIQIAFISFQRPIAIKIIRISSPFQMRPIVRTKNDQGIFFQSQFFHLVHDFSHLTIQNLNHRNESCMAFRLRLIWAKPVFFSLICSFVHFLRKIFPSVLVHDRVRSDQLRMGNRTGNKQEEWSILVIIDELQGPILNIVGDKISLFKALIFFEDDFFLIVPQIAGIVVMCQSLTIVANESVKALIVGITFWAGKSQPPFSKSACCIALLLEHFRQGEYAIRKRILPLWFDFFIATNKCMSGMEPSHESGSGGCTNRAARIVLEQLHSFCSHAIQIRSLEIFLAKGAQISIAQIVGENEDDIGGAISLVRRRSLLSGGTGK